MATALYRRYRPETFADVIGQDHVTAPLMRALRTGRIGHAYLFSGPRGCGKTTSARILARCLNCEQGPTDTPCGQCDSCRELATGGSGSLDVVEIDAASHGGVDDARELRERASFAPARDRFKVFIIDEAHMVTSAGFNALLKLVEEPPEHVKFVFATTEPDKVIGTIRSRTHHYPFRLIPPQVLTPYLREICEAEGVQVGDGVLPLVVRAGGGSARDTLSVLDQLMAGAGEEGIDHATAIALLGFTDTELLDRAIDAIGRRDAAAMYATVEQVISSGQEPRRFVEDLLERLRDLIILAAVPDRGEDLLPQLPADELAAMRDQVEGFEPVDLSRCGDLVNDTLSGMSGATSPRLHLELLAARLILRDQAAAVAAGGGAPAQPAGARGTGGQRAAGQGGVGQGTPVQGSTGQGRAPGGPGQPTGRDRARQIAQEQADAARRAREQQEGVVQAPAEPAAPEPGHADTAFRGAAPTGESRASAGASRAPAADDGWGPVAPIGGASAPAPDAVRPADQGEVGADQRAAHPADNASADEQQESAEQGETLDRAAPMHGGVMPQNASGDEPGESSASQGLSVAEIRGHWSAIVDELQQIRRPAWALVSQNAHVHGVQGSTLVLGFRTEGLVAAFRRGTNAQNVADAVRRVTRREVSVDAVAAEDPGDGGDGDPSPAAAAPSAPTQNAAPSAPTQNGPVQGDRTQRLPTADDRQGPHAAGRGGTEGSGARTPRRDEPRWTPPAGEDYPPEPDDEYPPDPMDQGGAIEAGAQSADSPGPLPDARAAQIQDADAAPDAAQHVDRAHGVDGPQDIDPPQTDASDQEVHAADSAAGSDASEGDRLAEGSEGARDLTPIEIPDDSRDDLPDDVPRTHGQEALRRAIETGRPVWTLPRESSGANAPAPAPAAPDPHANASATHAAHPVTDAPADDAARGPEQARGRGGAALVRDALAARGSRDPGRAGGRGSPGAPGPSGRDGGAPGTGRPGDGASASDPTGGASRDDEDAQYSSRRPQELIQDILGGTVLEVIDQTR